MPILTLFRNICHHNNIVLMPFTSHRVYTLTRLDLGVIRETHQDPRDTAQDKNQIRIVSSKIF